MLDKRGSVHSLPLDLVSKCFPVIQLNIKFFFFDAHKHLHVCVCVVVCVFCSYANPNPMQRCWSSAGCVVFRRQKMKNEIQARERVSLTTVSFHSPSPVQDFTVSKVPVCGGARLKNICSMGGPDTIIISGTNGARKTLRVKCVCVCRRNSPLPACGVFARFPPVPK